MLLGGYQIVDLSQLGILSSTEDSPEYIAIYFDEEHNNLYDTIISYLDIDKICYLTGLKFKQYNSNLVFEISGACVKQGHLYTDENNTVIGRTKSLEITHRNADFVDGIHIKIFRYENYLTKYTESYLSITFGFDNI